MKYRKFKLPFKPLYTIFGGGGRRPQYSGPRNPQLSGMPNIGKTLGQGRGYGTWYSRLPRALKIGRYGRPRGYKMRQPLRYVGERPSQNSEHAERYEAAPKGEGNSVPVQQQTPEYAVEQTQPDSTKTESPHQKKNPAETEPLTDYDTYLAEKRERIVAEATKKLEASMKQFEQDLSNELEKSVPTFIGASNKTESSIREEENSSQMVSSSNEAKGLKEGELSEQTGWPPEKQRILDDIIKAIDLSIGEQPAANEDKLGDLADNSEHIANNGGDASGTSVDVAQTSDESREATELLQAEPVQEIDSNLQSAENNEQTVAGVLDGLEADMAQIRTALADEPDKSTEGLLDLYDYGNESIEHALESLEQIEPVEKTEADPYAESESM